MSEKQSRKVLCLDDDPGILLSLGHHFKREGYGHLCTADSNEALAWIKEHQPRVVFSDYRMRNTNGLDFLKKVMEIHPSSIRILLSGMADEERIKKSMDEGEVHEFITKPWDPKSFKERLKLWLENGS